MRDLNFMANKNGNRDLSSMYSYKSFCIEEALSLYLKAKYASECIELSECDNKPTLEDPCNPKNTLESRTRR